ELDGAQLEQLQRRAREHGTTVHGALTAALAIAAGHDHQRRPSHIAIEDAAVLAHCLATIDDPQAALRAYENRRRDRARAMVETSRALSR
ncbi:hypothetical protein ACWWBI_03165, partial [Pseudomonas aeruginosa]